MNIFRLIFLLCCCFLVAPLTAATEVNIQAIEENLRELFGAESLGRKLSQSAVYRALVLKFHPDKNPSEPEIFLAVQEKLHAERKEEKEKLLTYDEALGKFKAL